MMRKTFVVDDGEYGIGLRPVDMPNADPLGRIGAVHDLMEHFPGDDGGVEAELMALGAAVYVRGEGGYFQQRLGNADFIENIASDFPDLFRHVHDEGFSLNDPGITRRLSEWSVEHALGQIVVKGARFLHEEEVLPLTAQDRIRVRGWMRKGYRKAVRRYKGLNPCELADLFRRAQECFRDEYDPELCGMLVRLTIDLRAQRAYVQESFSEGEYWE